MFDTTCEITPEHSNAGNDVTTLMIRNLPHDMPRQEILDEIHSSGFKGFYDFFHMPCDFGSGTGKGYAFINLFSGAAAEAFKVRWHKACVLGTKVLSPPLNISPASIQGFKANMKKWDTPRLKRIRDASFRPFVAGRQRQQPVGCTTSAGDSLQSSGACGEASASPSASSSNTRPPQTSSSGLSDSDSDSGEFEDLMNSAVQAFLRGEEEAMCIDVDDKQTEEVSTVSLPAPPAPSLEQHSAARELLPDSELPALRWPLPEESAASELLPVAEFPQPVGLLPEHSATSESLPPLEFPVPAGPLPQHSAASGTLPVSEFPTPHGSWPQHPVTSGSLPVSEFPCSFGLLPQHSDASESLHVSEFPAPLGPLPQQSAASAPLPVLDFPAPPESLPQQSAASESLFDSEFVAESWPQTQRVTLSISDLLILQSPAPAAEQPPTEENETNASYIDSEMSLEPENIGTQDFTTMMIRNIPPEITQQDLLVELDRDGFRGLYDYCHVPCSGTVGATETGKGYAFINLVSVAVAEAFRTRWHKTRRFKPTSGPTLSISPASIQGFDANVEKWKKTRWRRIRDERWRPWVMYPTNTEFATSPPTGEI